MKTLSLALAAICAASGVFAQAPAATVEPPAAAADPAAPTSASASVSKSDAVKQLAAARRELMLLRTRHGDKHPMVMKQVRKVAELQKKVAARAEPDVEPADRPGQLDAAKRELARLREHFTDEHPVVKGQLRKVAELEKAVAVTGDVSPSPTGR